VNVPVIRRESCPVLPGPDKHSRPHLPKDHDGHFQSFHGHLYKNLLLHDITKQNINKKPKKKHKCLGRDFVIYLFLLSIFGLNNTQIFEIILDFFHGTLLLLPRPPGNTEAG
jgi:hypothetical protein